LIDKEKAIRRGEWLVQFGSLYCRKMQLPSNSSNKKAEIIFPALNRVIRLRRTGTHTDFAPLIDENCSFQQLWEIKIIYKSMI
jgi:hypothetical protein